MAQPLIAPLPPDLALYAGCTIRVRAISPTTGANITGVTLSNVSLFVRNVGGGANEALASGSFQLVPGPGA